MKIHLHLTGKTETAQKIRIADLVSLDSNVNSDDTHLLFGFSDALPLKVQYSQLDLKVVLELLRNFASGVVVAGSYNIGSTVLEVFPQ
jgi:hypothetical protein